MPSGDRQRNGTVRVSRYHGTAITVARDHNVQFTADGSDLMRVARKVSFARTALAVLLGFSEGAVTRAAEKSNAVQLTELARSPSPKLRDAIVATFEAKDLKEGTAWAGLGS